MKIKVLKNQRQTIKAGLQGKLRYVVNVGGFGSGKTYAGALTAWLLALNRPMSRGLVGSCSYRQLIDTVKEEFDIIGQHYGFANRAYPFEKSNMTLRLKNGSVILFRSMEIGPKLLSLNLHWYWVDQAESVKKRDFGYLDSRVRGTFKNPVIKERMKGKIGVGLLTGNPMPGGWLEGFYREFGSIVDLEAPRFNKRGEYIIGNDDSNGLLIRSTTHDNKFLPEGYADNLIKQYGGEDSPVTQRLIYGQDVSFGGLVYPMFRKDTHVIQPFDIPKAWEKFAAIDLGYVNPFVYLLFAEDPHGRVYQIYEHYVRQKPISYHASAIKHAETRYEWNVGAGKIPIKRFSDHDAQDRAELEEHEIFTEPAKKDIISGVHEVMRYLSLWADGKPGLQIFSTCVNTIREAGEYMWDPNAKGDVPMKPPTGNVEEGIIPGDHAMDDWRYGLFSRKHSDSPMSTSTGGSIRNPFG